MRFALILLLCSLSAPALAKDPFPRCTLDPASLKAFHGHYGQARLWTMEGEHEKARGALEAALRLCVDAELLLQLADNAKLRGDVGTATRYHKEYDAQIARERRIARAVNSRSTEPRRLRLEPDPVHVDPSTSPRRLVLGARPSLTPIFIETTPALGTSIEVLDPSGTSRFVRAGAAERLPPGRYTIIVRANGWNTVRREIEVTGSKVLKMIFVLSRSE